mgnify:CR=1 FL=1
MQQQLTVPEIENVKLNIPSLDKQKELSTKVSKIEKEIEKLMSKLVDFNNMKNDLIKKLIKANVLEIVQKGHYAKYRLVK